MVLAKTLVKAGRNEEARQLSVQALTAEQKIADQPHEEDAPSVFLHHSLYRSDEGMIIRPVPIHVGEDEIGFVVFRNRFHTSIFLKGEKIRTRPSV